MSSKFFKDERPIPITTKLRKRGNFNPLSAKADLVMKTLERDYPNEIKEIHLMQHQDMTIHGSIQPATEAKMNLFLDKVVEDNKKNGRTTTAE